MELPSKDVYEILRKNGLNYVYHANSVITSCQFLRNGALLSRGSIEERGLFQTPQYTDDIDRKYGIWFDVFSDSVDIHERTRDINLYGPVLFVLDTKLLPEVDGEAVGVTKLNPTKWAGKRDDERWFSSLPDFDKNFVRGDFNQMIVFRKCSGVLSIENCLKEIILDDPKETTSNYFEAAYEALSLAMAEGGISAPITKRECSRWCTCAASYNKSSTRTEAMYSIKI